MTFQGTPRLSQAGAGSWAWGAGSLLWLLVVGECSWILVNHANTPGEQRPAAASWPGESALTLDSHLPTLLVFAHPRCPCTEASIGELARLTALVRGRVKTSVIFFKPAGETAGWQDGGLWRQAVRIPGVEARADVNGREARLFGATTSGHAALYAPDGQRLFAGGITPARGHHGDSAGREFILRLLDGESLSPGVLPVFGCSIACAPTNDAQRHRKDLR